MAGIRTGDVFVELNGKVASDYDEVTFGALMCSRDGDEVTSSFRRGASQQTVKLKLRRAI